jgi:hypothetical protein
MHKKHLDSGQLHGELKITIPARVFVQQVNPELSEQEWATYEQKQCSSSGWFVYIKTKNGVVAFSKLIN